MEQTDKSGVLSLAAIAKPALKTGDYVIEAEQELKKSTGETIVTFGKTIRHFSVNAEQVSMLPNQVYSVYPPRGAAGKYEKTLPSIVLNRRTLPWERDIDADRNSPWLALLLFNEDEISGLLSDEPVHIRRLKYSAVDGDRKNHKNIFIPQLSGAVIPGDTDCLVVDIPRHMWDILPSKADLPYLAHVRDVSLDCKVTDAAVTDGGFACILANRLPKPPEENSGVKNVEHTALLVSLEGLIGNNGWEMNETHDMVRMFVFALWSFFCEESEFDFVSAAGNLDVGVLRPNPELYEGHPFADILKKGYYPMNHCFREGSLGVSFYRPPLLPEKPEFENNTFAGYADELLRFDPDLQLYDTTQSAAWQLGRLLSMQNEALAKDILTWRTMNKLEVAKINNQRTVGNAARAMTKKKVYAERTGDTPEGHEWCAVVPDLDSAAGIEDAVDLKGAELPPGDIDVLLSHAGADAFQKPLTDKSAQKQALEPFEAAGEDD